jgi:hypothetical protein
VRFARLLPWPRLSAVCTSSHSTPSSSIACASVNGESDSHAHERSDHTSASAETPPPGSGHAPSLSLTRRSATRPLGRSRPGRTIWSFPLRPAALLGFNPSQVCSRGGWICISAHPGPRAFLIAPSDPINFRRVDSPRPSCVSVREKAKANRGRRDVGFWASLPSAVRFAIFSPRRTRARQVLESRSILPWALPLSGMRAHIRASMRARPRVDHQPPDASLDTPHPLMCLCDPSRDVRFSALPPRSRRLL